MKTLLLIITCLSSTSFASDRIRACNNLSSSYIRDCLKGPRYSCVPNTVTLPKFSN